MTALGKIVVGIVAIIVLGLAWFGYRLISAPATAPQQQIATSTQAAATSSTILSGVPDATYVNSKLSFSITYPSSATSSAVDFAGYLPLTQTPLTSFVLPKSMYEGTNLGEAGVYVGATTTPAALEACTKSAPLQGETALGSTTINDADFWVYSSEGVGAGNIYDEKIYRRLENGWCVELVEMLHSGNIGNYTPGTVTAFDQAKFSGILESIVHTYRSIPTGL